MEVIGFPEGMNKMPTDLLQPMRECIPAKCNRRL